MLNLQHLIESYSVHEFIIELCFDYYENEIEDFFKSSTRIEESWQP